MEFKVDRSSSQPLYIQLAGWLEARIISGEIRPDEKLPGEVELAESLGVSRGSLRKAMAQLIDRGLVVQIHGKGTFVGQPVNEQKYAGRLSVYQDLLLAGIPFTTDVIEKRIIPVPNRESQILGLVPAEAVVYLKYLRRVDEEPLVVHESFLPASRFAGLLKEDFRHSGMVEAIERRYDITLGWTNNTISVAKANSNIAALLGLMTGDPVLLNESELFDNAGGKLETGLTWFRPDKFKLQSTVRRAQNEPFYTLLSRSGLGIPRPASSELPTRPVSRMPKVSGLSDFLPIERILVRYPAKDWEDAVLMAGKLLASTGVVEEYYGQAMVKTARQLGPYNVVSPGIAVAHALPHEGVIHPALALITLHPPVRFGSAENDPVRLLIAIAALDSTRHVDALREMAEVLYDPNRRNALMQAASSEEAFDILMKG